MKYFPVSAGSSSVNVNIQCFKISPHSNSSISRTVEDVTTKNNASSSSSFPNLTVSFAYSPVQSSNTSVLMFLSCNIFCDPFALFPMQCAAYNDRDMASSALEIPNKWCDCLVEYLCSFCKWLGDSELLDAFNSPPHSLSNIVFGLLTCSIVAQS